MQASKEKPKEAYRQQNIVGGAYVDNSLPELERQRQERIRRLQELEKQQIELHEKRITDGIQGRRRNAKAYDNVTVAMAMLAFAILLASSLMYVGRNQQLNTSNKKVAALKQEYQQLQTENDNREGMINASIDAQEIYRIATEELGMSYPEKHQVITYQKEESGYVAQYEDIPE